MRSNTHFDNNELGISDITHTPDMKQPREIVQTQDNTGQTSPLLRRHDFMVELFNACLTNIGCPRQIKVTIDIVHTIVPLFHLDSDMIT